MLKGALVTTAACVFGAKQQTPDHILHYCPIYNLTRIDGLSLLDDDTNIGGSVCAQTPNTADLKNNVSYERRKRTIKQMQNIIGLLLN